MVTACLLTTVTHTHYNNVMEEKHCYKFIQQFAKQNYNLFTSLRIMLKNAVIFKCLKENLILGKNNVLM